MLEDKAKELGRMIGQTPEYQAVKRANDALSGDKEAVTLLQSMEGLRQRAQQMIARGEQPSEEMEQENPTYQRAVVAQENFDKLMMRVNDWILDGIKKGAASPIITLT